MTETEYPTFPDIFHFRLCLCATEGIFRCSHNRSRKYCQKYVNGFSFSLNEGNCQRDTQDRLDDLFRNMAGKTITYDQLTA